MKLNNKGWSTINMIIMICFLLLMLGIAWYFISVLYNGMLDNDKVNRKVEIYDRVKTDLQLSAMKYYEETNMFGDAIISYDLLKEKGYIDKLQDYANKPCNGYVVVKNNDFKPYIRCQNYTSKDYVNDFE